MKVEIREATYDGECFLRVIQSQADLLPIDMNLGVISASKLHLGILPRDREAVPQMFRLLRETTLPGLRHLIITLSTLWSRAFRRVTFDPMSCFEEAGAGLAQTWKLDPSVADRLDSVLIDLDAVYFVKRASEFFQLFGAANSPGVLRVSPERAQLTKSLAR
jgi:hypothetical protein